MGTDLLRRCGAEALGTAMLVLFGAGSVVAALRTGEGELTYPGLGFIALAFAIVVAVAVYAFGPVSGAHINPAVTFGLAVAHRFPWVEVVPYVVAQLVGGAVGGLLIIAAFTGDAVDFAVGATVLGEGVEYWQGIVAEVLGTYILVFAIMAIAVDPRAPAGWAGWIIGLAVACAILLIGPLTGGSLNPARTFGPYIAGELFGSDVVWSEFPLYWAGPLLGAALAALSYDFLVRPGAEQPAAPLAPETPGRGGDVRATEHDRGSASLAPETPGRGGDVRATGSSGEPGEPPRPQP